MSSSPLAAGCGCCCRSCAPAPGLLQEAAPAPRTASPDRRTPASASRADRLLPPRGRRRPEEGPRRRSVSRSLSRSTKLYLYL